MGGQRGVQLLEKRSEFVWVWPLLLFGRHLACLKSVVHLHPLLKVFNAIGGKRQRGEVETSLLIDVVVTVRAIFVGERLRSLHQRRTMCLRSKKDGENTRGDSSEPGAARGDPLDND